MEKELIKHASLISKELKERDIKIKKREVLYLVALSNLEHLDKECKEVIEVFLDEEKHDIDSFITKARHALFVMYMLDALSMSIIDNLMITEENKELLDEIMLNMYKAKDMKEVVGTTFVIRDIANKKLLANVTHSKMESKYDEENPLDSTVELLNKYVPKVKRVELRK